MSERALVIATHRDEDRGSGVNADRSRALPFKRRTEEEEHILRCLGAAVIMHWNDLPTDIQRELFDHAISMGELGRTAELKDQVARFLRKYKHGEPG